MGISLVTFSGSTVTSQDDALVYETALTGSGLIYGGTVTIKSANTLHIAAAHGALCGRKFTIDETDVPVSLTSTGSLNGRLYIHMDLSDTDEPIKLMVETAGTLTPVIQEQNVNINYGVYEINLATFVVDTSTISDLTNVAPYIQPATPPETGSYNVSDPTETSMASGDFIPFQDISADQTKKIALQNLLAVGTTGTASASAVSYQYIKAGGTNYEIKGTKYMEQTKTLSTSGDVTYTFTNSAITTNSVIEPYASIYGIVPTSITVTNGSCSVVIPQYTSAASCKVRIYIK